MAKGGITKLTPENRAKLEQAAAIGASIAEMAYYCDVSRQTVYNWLEEDKDLFDKIERLREKPILKARQTIINGLDQVNNAQWYLERRAKAEFSTKHEIDHTSKGERIFSSVSEMTNDQLERIARGGQEGTSEEGTSEEAL